jgi:hypothetical protein
MMFHQGDLQSGIALAVKDTKSVVCFVRGMSSTSLSFPASISFCMWIILIPLRYADDTDESTLWENEYFDDEVIPTLKNKQQTNI